MQAVPGGPFNYLDASGRYGLLDKYLVQFNARGCFVGLETANLATFEEFGVEVEPKAQELGRRHGFDRVVYHYAQPYEPRRGQIGQFDEDHLWEQGGHHTGGSTGGYYGSRLHGGSSSGASYNKRGSRRQKHNSSRDFTGGDGGPLRGEFWGSSSGGGRFSGAVGDFHVPRTSTGSVVKGILRNSGGRLSLSSGGGLRRSGVSRSFVRVSSAPGRRSPASSGGKRGSAGIGGARKSQSLDRGSLDDNFRGRRSESGPRSRGGGSFQQQCVGAGAHFNNSVGGPSGCGGYYDSGGGGPGGGKYFRGSSGGGPRGSTYERAPPPRGDPRADRDFRDNRDQHFRDSRDTPSRDHFRDHSSYPHPLPDPGPLGENICSTASYAPHAERQNPYLHFLVGFTSDERLFGTFPKAMKEVTDLLVANPLLRAPDGALVRDNVHWPMDEDGGGGVRRKPRRINCIDIYILREQEYWLQNREELYARLNKQKQGGGGGQQASTGVYGGVHARSGGA